MLVVRSAQKCADLAGCRNKCAGLALVDQLEGLGGHWLAFRQDVYRLPTHQPARRAGQDRDRSDHSCRVRFGRSQDIESQSKQGISRKDRYRFAELHVACRPTAPEIVVVQRGKVVVDEGKTVDQLDGACGVECHVRASPDGFGGPKHERWPNALARSERGVPHGLMKQPWLVFWGGQYVVQSLIDRACVGL